MLVPLSLLTAASAPASCTSRDGDGEEGAPAPIDAGTRATSDAGEEAQPTPEAGTSVSAPLPIVCTSPPCATSLVTTIGAALDDLSEGFCALLSDGSVACWGANRAGQLGRGEDAGTIDSASAARVVGLSNVTKLDHTCAIDASGAVWCWGTGPFFRDGAAAVTTERAPVKLNLPPATTVALGYTTACAGVHDGVLCWGSNADGQLGPNTAPEDTGLPRTMPIPAGSPVRALAVGRATFVLREDGTLVTWGANPPIGRRSSAFPDPYPQSAGLGGVLMTDLAGDNACATAGGTGYCWGVPVLPTTSGTGSIVERALPEPIVTPEPVLQIATTRTYVIENVGVERYRWCASAVSGILYCWGFNESGQAGDGTQDYAFDAVKVQGLPERVAQVKTTPNTTCALLTSGKVYCWGSNYNGQLGNGKSKGRSLVPTEVKLP